MEQSNLKPFLRNDLDILFVGLNPADFLIPVAIL